MTTLSKENFSNLASSLILALTLCGVVLFQYYYDLQKKERPLLPPTIIPAGALKIIDLGLHSVAASAMWVYTIQQASDHPDKLPELIENVTEIDPRFSYPYAFAALVLPDISNSPKKAVELAKKGIELADPDWRVPYYLGTTYHIFFHDRKNAAFYFNLAASTPGATERLKFIASSYGTAPTLREQTRQIWISIYENSNDEIVKERAYNNIVHLEILNELDKALGIYVRRYLRLPEKIEDFVTSGIVKEVPKSPLGLRFYFESGRVVAR